MNSPIRFTGLTSGIDTQAMVTQMMRAENMRMTRLTQRRQILQWRQEDLRATRTTLMDFQSRHTVATNAGAIANTLASGPWNTMRAAVTGVNGNSTAGITVTTTSQARQQNLRVEVVQTAAAQFSVGRGVTTEERTQIQNAHFAESEITINGTTVELQAGTIQSAIDQFNRSGIEATIRFDNLRGAFTIEGTRPGVALNVTADTGNLLTALRLTDDTTNWVQGPHIENFDASVLEFFEPAANGEYIFYDGEFRPIVAGEVGTHNSFDRAYIDDLVTSNPANPRLLNFIFMRENDQIPNPEFPHNSPDPYIDVAPTPTSAFTPGPFVPPSGAPIVANHSLSDATGRGTEARRALIQIHDDHGLVTGPSGNAYFSYDTNVIRTLIEGVTIDISGATGRERDVNNVLVPGSEGQTVNINVYRNVDDIMDTIRDFIDEYNNLIRHLNSLHSTARPRAGNSVRGAFFEPLTDEQRQAMSDREVERWEEQARIGLLHRDNDIRSIQQQLRQAMMEPLVLPDGTGLHLSHFGINTVGMSGAAEDRLIGVLEIFDEDRLRAALEEDPDRVQQLFARHPAELANDPNPEISRLAVANNIRDRNARQNQIGLANRLRDVIENVANDHDSVLRQRVGVIGGIDATENTLSRQIREYDRRIEQMQQWLIRRENHFFSMFARMEQAMAQSNQQMDALFAFAMQ